ncbi:MAG: OmpA family protein [Fusobacteria bacterium]|nr:OmpA family protein [Fusobacteriota bacterium]
MGGPSTLENLLKEETSKVSLPYSLYLGDNIYKLFSRQKNILIEFAKTYLSSPTKKKLYATGYTDGCVTISNEYFMSKNRAFSVSNFLKSCGVPSYSIEIAYFGSSIQARSNATNSGRAKNRRVVIAYKKPFSPIKTTNMQPSNSYNFINMK